MGSPQDGGAVVDADASSEFETGSDAGLGDDARDAGDAGFCSNLTVALRDVQAAADPSEPPPAIGGTIGDGTYHMKKFIFYRR